MALTCEICDLSTRAVDVDENELLGLEACSISAFLSFLSGASAVVGSDDQVAAKAASSAVAMLYLISGRLNTSPAEYPSKSIKKRI